MLHQEVLEYTFDDEVQEFYNKRGKWATIKKYGSEVYLSVIRNHGNIRLVHFQGYVGEYIKGTNQPLNQIYMINVDDPKYSIKCSTVDKKDEKDREIFARDISISEQVRERILRSQEENRKKEQSRYDHKIDIKSGCVLFHNIELKRMVVNDYRTKGIGLVMAKYNYKTIAEARATILKYLEDIRKYEVENKQG